MKTSILVVALASCLLNARAGTLNGSLSASGILHAKNTSGQNYNPSPEIPDGTTFAEFNDSTSFDFYLDGFLLNFSGDGDFAAITERPGENFIVAFPFAFDRDDLAPTENYMVFMLPDTPSYNEFTFFNFDTTTFNSEFSETGLRFWGEGVVRKNGSSATKTSWEIETGSFDSEYFLGLNAELRFVASGVPVPDYETTASLLVLGLLPLCLRARCRR